MSPQQQPWQIVARADDVPDGYPLRFTRYYWSGGQPGSEVVPARLLRRTESGRFLVLVADRDGRRRSRAVALESLSHGGDDDAPRPLTLDEALDMLAVDAPTRAAILAAAQAREQDAAHAGHVRATAARRTQRRGRVRYLVCPVCGASVAPSELPCADQHGAGSHDAGEAQG